MSISHATDSHPGLTLDDQLCFAAYSASRALVGAYRRRLTRLGLTYTQYLVLLVLWQQTSTSMRDLGRALDLESGTLTPVLQRMEAGGLLERRRGTEDERTVVVSLAERGAALQPAVRDVQAEVTAETGLSAADVRALREELRELAAALDGA